MMASEKVGIKFEKIHLIHEILLLHPVLTYVLKF